MQKLILLVLLCVMTNFSYADSSQALEFKGQTGDTFALDIVNTVTRYREEQRDSTCTRKVPYETEECGYETRYRQECRWEPGRNVCRTEYETRCRTVTRYRRECRRGPDRRVCRQTDPRTICRNGNCRTIPGRRICDTKPGQQICRQVPYQDRECTREPRRVCDWQAGRNVCDQVPYQEWVCRMVTRYRDEQYACQRTVRIPYDFDREVKGDVTVSYRDQSPGAFVDLLFKITESGDVTVKANDKSEKPVLIGLSKEVDQDVQDDATETKASFAFTFLDKEEELAPIKKTIHSAGLTETAAWFTMGRITNPDRIKVSMTITRKTIFGNVRTPFQKVLNANDFKLTRTGDGTKMLLDLSKYGVELDDKEWTLKLEISLNFEETIINGSRDTLKRNQEFEIRVD